VVFESGLAQLLTQFFCGGFCGIHSAALVKSMRR
jgi:hypothetical protein